MGPEPAEARASYGLITNFGRMQEEDLGVCTLEAAVRLGELVGQLPSSERTAAQKALNAYLEGKPIGTSARAASRG